MLTSVRTHSRHKMRMIAICTTDDAELYCLTAFAVLFFQSSYTHKRRPTSLIVTVTSPETSAEQDIMHHQVIYFACLDSLSSAIAVL